MEATKKVFDFLEKAGTFYLATVEGDQPRVRPYGAMLYFEDKIYIMAFDQCYPSDCQQLQGRDLCLQGSDPAHRVQAG